MELFEYLATTNLQLSFDEELGIINRLAQHIADSQELRHTFVDDAAVRRDGHLTIGEGIECVNLFVAAHSRHQMNQYLHLRSRVILNLTCFNLTLIHRLRDGLDKRFSSLAVRNLTDDEGLIVEFLNLGTNLHDTSTLSVVILRNIDGTAR